MKRITKERLDLQLFAKGDTIKAGSGPADDDTPETDQPAEGTKPETKPEAPAKGADEAKKQAMTDRLADRITNATARELAKQPKVRLRLHQNPVGQPQLRDETVCINGYIYQIKRGVSVDVPKSVAEVLEHAGLI